MPIYAFECAACGHRFDKLQKLSDPDPTACPACNADAIKRQVTAPAFRLAGGGWYETDFKKDSDRKRNLVEKGEGAKAESKSESAPAKTETTASSAASAPKAAAD